MRLTAVLATLLISLGATACGGDSGDPVLPDAGDGDGDGDGDADAAVANCLAQADFGAATIGNQQAASDAAVNPTAALVGGLLNADANPDVFQLELYKGFGIFTVGEIVPGTYPITGPELDYATCGVCPRIFTDIDPATGMASDAGYYATGGTVEITTTTPNLTGTLTGVTFQHVNIDMTTFASTPHPDGCLSGITTAAFDAVVMVQAPAP